MAWASYGAPYVLAYMVFQGSPLAEVTHNIFIYPFTHVCLCVGIGCSRAISSVLEK